MLHVEALEYWGSVSYLKGGINFSETHHDREPDATRSEILTPELGFGLDGVLRGAPTTSSGILNGIDVERWDPARDALVAGDILRETNSTGKAAARKACSKPSAWQAVTVPVAPVIGLVSRLTDQKGFDLIAAAAARADVARRDVGDARQRRRALRGSVARPRGAFPRSRVRDDRIRRARWRT